MDMGKIIGAVVTISVGVILMGTLLAPQIAEYTGESGALAEYAPILGAVISVTVVALMMVAVRLIIGKRD